MAILLIHVELVREERDEKKRRRKKICKKEDKFNFYCLVGFGYEIYVFIFVSFLSPHFLPTFLFVFFQTKDNTKFINQQSFGSIGNEVPLSGLTGFAP